MIQVDDLARNERNFDQCPLGITPREFAGRTPNRSFRIPIQSFGAGVQQRVNAAGMVLDGGRLTAEPDQQLRRVCEVDGFDLQGAELIFKMAATAVSRDAHAYRSVRYWAGLGNTLNVNSVIAPNWPTLPTKNFGRSKPAAFLTTLPPAHTSCPRPSMNRIPRMKSRNPPCAIREGPFSPAATTPPKVAPRSTIMGSNGMY